MPSQLPYQYHLPQHQLFVCQSCFQKIPLTKNYPSLPVLKPRPEKDSLNHYVVCVGSRSPPSHQNSTASVAVFLSAMAWSWQCHGHCHANNNNNKNLTYLTQTCTAHQCQGTAVACPWHCHDNHGF